VRSAATSALTRVFDALWSEAEGERNHALQTRDRQGKNSDVAVPDQQRTALRLWKDRASRAGELHSIRDTPF